MWEAAILTSILNARDIGGMTTATGRTVLAGRVWRSGSVSSIDEADLEHLVRL